MINTKKVVVLDPQEETVPLTFTRASVAYDYQGNSVPVNTPRFTHLIGGTIQQGCLIEEAHTNLLTANQSTGTDTLGDTTGFNITTANDRISSSSDYSLQGSKSLKVVTGNIAGGSNVEGVWTPTSITVSPNTSHTASVWVKGSGTVALSLIERDADDVLIGETYSSAVTLTDQWQLVTVTRDFGATGVKARIAVRTVSQQSATFYVDMLQLTATAYPLSWTLGGTTQAAETLTAPSSVLDLTQGTIEMEFVESPGYKNAVNHYLFEHQNILKNRCCIVRLASGTLTNRMSNNAEQSSNSGNILDTLDLWSNNTVSMSWDSTILNLFLNGVNSGSPAANPYLPEVKQTIYLGGYTNQCNTLIRNVTISKVKRSDADITTRSNTPGFGKDRQVTLHAPLQHDLKAVRIRR